MRKIIPNLVLLLVLFISCEDESNEFDRHDSTICEEVILTANSTRSNELNDIISLHEVQSDQMSMIIDCIVRTDSAFYLSLSLEDSRLLGIPDSIYEIGISIVLSLNTQK